MTTFHAPYDPEDKSYCPVELERVLTGRPAQRSLTARARITDVAKQKDVAYPQNARAARRAQAAGRKRQEQKATRNWRRRQLADAHIQENLAAVARVFLSGSKSSAMERNVEAHVVDVQVRRARQLAKEAADGSDYIQHFPKAADEVETSLEELLAKVQAA